MAERDPIDIAARALAHRDRPRAEIAERLARAGIGDEAQEEALETLERLGYVDDARFAHSRAGSLAARGYGDDYIRHDLATKGVGFDAADEAIAALVPERDRAVELADRLGRTPKTAAHLARKGFGPDALEGLAGPASAEIGIAGHDL